MHTKKLIAGAVSAALVSLGAVSAAQTAHAEGTTLVVDTSFLLKTVDPGRMFETTGLMIDRALYSTLLTFAGGDVTKPVPDLAESYQASPDGKTFTFKLRKDAVFSDGTPVTADDVVFSLTRVANLKGNPSFLMAGLKVTATDPATVVITSETPNMAVPFIVPNPALGILNSKAVKAAGGTEAEGADTADKAEESLNKASQGSGPYVLSSYNNTTEVVLTKNPKYWGTAAHYDKVVVRNVEASVQKLNVGKGESQLAIDLSPAQADGMTGVNVINGASSNVMFLLMNQSADVSKITSNPDIQEAIRYGVDYDALLAVAGKGAVQAAGVIPSMFLGALSAPTVKRDVARAKAAVAKSGIASPSIKLEFPTDYQVDGLNFPDLAAIVQANLDEVGIKVELVGGPIATTLDNYRGGKEELGLWWWGPDYPDPSDYLPFLPGNSLGKRANWMAGTSADLEKLGKDAAANTDDASRAAQYQKIQEQLNTASPWVPLIQPAKVVVAGTAVQNVTSNAVWSITLGELG